MAQPWTGGIGYHTDTELYSDVTACDDAARGLAIALAAMPPGSGVPFAVWDGRPSADA